MRLAIYVPCHQAERWGEGMTFEQFQKAVIAATGGITVMHGTHLNDRSQQAVLVVEALMRMPAADEWRNAWALFREYAQQLIAQGEPSVLIVHDNEPTVIT